MSFRTKFFTIRYSPNAIIPPVANRYLTSHFNPLQPKIRHMYKNRDPSTLWWMVSAHNLLSQKRVVRTWLSRRTRAAFQQALRDYGFDSQGKRLAPPFIKKPGSRGCVNDLTGTVEITLNPRMYGGDLSGLDSDMAVTLKTILRHRKGKGRPAVAEGEAVAGGEAVVEKGHLLGVQQS